MATREITTTVTTDDLNGDLGAKPRTFAIGGVEYALDLTDVNYDKLVQAVSDFVNAATKPGYFASRAPYTRNYKSYAERNRHMFDLARNSHKTARELAKDFDLTIPRVYQILANAARGRFGSTQPTP